MNLSTTGNSEKLEQLYGFVEKTIFQNEQTGYGVVLIKPEGAESFVATGFLQFMYPGSSGNFLGRWISHSKFGRQFEVSSVEQKLPTNEFGIEKYLSSGLIKGIGPGFAKKLVAKFGSKTLEIIDENPQVVASVPGIGPSRVQAIVQGWKEQKASAQVMVFLRSVGISVNLAGKIYKLYGAAAVEKIKTNPYRLSEDIWGVGFKAADAIAQKMGILSNSLERMSAAILHILKQAMERGSLYLKALSLEEECLELLKPETMSSEFFQEGLELLLSRLKVKHVKFQGTEFIGLARAFFVENRLAETLQKLLDSSAAIEFNQNQLFLQLKNIEQQGCIQLSERQKEAILSALSNKITIITGGPGTGKTTILKYLLRVLKEKKVGVKLAAPTGKAAKRMSEVAGTYATTLHRMLEFNPSSMVFECNEKKPLNAEFIIIDEFSMVDSFLACALFRAVSRGSRVVILGDVDQLASVGPGKVFLDLINSEKVPVVLLNQIFRQAKESLIVQNAHKVNQGTFPAASSSNPKSDFLFVPLAQAENFKHLLKSVYTDLLPQRKISPENSIVLVPMHRGIVGTTQINSDLQDLLNKEQSGYGLAHFQREFRVGDRVMQLKNNYDYNVFNGDMGRVSQVDLDKKQVFVRFLDKVQTYEYSNLSDLALAYATSIHKSQGSEFEAVIIPLFMQHFMMLQRKVIYTAITRAKKLCVLVGQKKSIAIGVKNDKEVERISFLKNLLQGSFFE